MSQNNLIPVAMKIAAQTIGLDLVAVKPLSSPRVDFGYMDFKYGPTKEEIQIWESEIIDNKIDNLLNGTPLKDIPKPWDY